VEDESNKTEDIKETEIENKSLENIPPAAPTKLISREQAAANLLEQAGIAKPEDIFKTQGQVKFYLVEQPIFYDLNGLWWIWIDA
jgi:hypothetical protein